MGQKYIFVTGGVVSSLGKGVAAASIGCLLESRGLRVTLQKCDPYLNVDPGTMSPYQHGEVYVTDDGAETDLDLANTGRSPPGGRPADKIGRPAEFTSRSSPKNAAAITWARPCRLFRTLRTKSRRRSAKSRLTPTW